MGGGGVSGELARLAVGRELDLATLWKWRDLAKQQPEYYRDYNTYAERIRDVNQALHAENGSVKSLGEAAIEEFILGIKTGGDDVPVPDQFRHIDPARIRQYLPRQHARNRPPLIEAPDAPLGYATPVHLPDNPLMLRFYQLDRQRAAATIHVDVEDMTPGEYQLHELGPITVTPDCKIEFSARSGQTHLQLGSRLYEPGAGNTWDAYVSLKFDGPAYGGTADEDQVLVGRIILISTSPGLLGLSRPVGDCQSSTCARSSPGHCILNCMVWPAGISTAMGTPMSSPASADTDTGMWGKMARSTSSGWNWCRERRASRG